MIIDVWSSTRMTPDHRDINGCRALKMGPYHYAPILSGFYRYGAVVFMPEYK
jgi:hypothetical protein